ncbi:YncE family protein [Flavobacterium sp.]|uniref:YncE family protein n=1 Tax=Flavobacterium sp. TaxID=239 RepID=UPI00374FF7CE
MKFSKLVFVALVSSVFFVSCSDDDAVVETPLGSYDNGVLILNQGGFGHGDASVSYLSDDFATQQNNIFSIVNPTITLGDTGQDVGLYQNLAFIVLNYSNKIEVVNRYTMVHVATITTGLNNPRYIAFSNGKGFVTNWGDAGIPTDDYVAVLNLSSYAVSSTIPVAEGPERIIENDNKLYVAQTGGYGYGNKISVINGTNNTLTTTINVGDVPNSLEVNNGSLYVICGGKPSYAPTETAGSFVKINLTNNTVTSTLNFPAASHPSNLDIVDNNVFYTVGSSIFKSTLSATTLPTTALFTTTAQGVYGVYSFSVHNDKVYVGDAGDYNSNGKIYVYSSTGILEHNYTVGVIPAGFYFN